MRRRLMVLMVLGLVGSIGALAACANPPVAYLPPTQPIDEEPLLHQQAADALRRWEEAVAAAGGMTGFVPVSDPLTIVGNFEPAIADNAKLALASGAIVIANVSPVLVIPAGKVVWADGTTRPVHTLSVAEALIGINMHETNGPLCGACTPLRVVSAQPIIVQVETTRGPATARRRGSSVSRVRP